MKLKTLHAQNKLLRTAMVQIVNDPEQAVAFALRAIEDCKRLEEYEKRKGQLK
jgi:hypothetical protein